MSGDCDYEFRKILESEDTSTIALARFTAVGLDRSNGSKFPRLVVVTRGEFPGGCGVDSMTGLIGFAPIYLNGVFALFFVMIVPGLVFVSANDISNCAQRWFVVFLASLTANHLLVTLIAALHFDPRLIYRFIVAALIAVLILLKVRDRTGPASKAYRDLSIASLRDVGWLVLGFVALGLIYLDVWKHGLPNTFEGGDVSYSWNTWALLWSQGRFPVSSLGYPQFVPTIWAVTYIFTGSTEQYFAFYIYVAWIVITVVLTGTNLGRTGWWKPLVFGFALAWLVAEIRDPWLKSCLRQGYPDWVAAIFGYSGVAMFVASAPEGRFDREKITAAFLSLCLLSIAAATKPLFGLFAIAVLIGICVDAAKYLEHGDRKRLMIAAVGLVAAFVAAYVLDYVHLTVGRAPPYAYSLSERLSRAVALLDANFTLPFRVMALAGLVLSPFLRRVRWLSLPLAAGVWLWASTASYDLRNLLGLLLISIFIPLYALARAYVPTRRKLSDDRRWSVPDGAIAAGLVVLCFAMTFTLAQGDKELKQRFATDQLTKDAGLEINRKIEQLLVSGCTIFNSDNYLYTIAAFERFNDQLPFFHAGDPLTEGLVNEVNKTSGCKSFFYPPDRTHPSVLSYISVVAQNYAKVIEGRGVVLLVSSPGPSDAR
jgi:hypothetical protein